MRRRAASIRFALACSVALAALSAPPVEAGSFYGPADFHLAGGWAWPVLGNLADGWNSGFTLAGGFRSQVAPNVRGGIDVGYSWLGLDADFFESRQPGFTISGGDAGVLAITSETDILLIRENGGARPSLQPFINAGLGFYMISIADVSVRGAGSGSFDPSQYDVNAFGLHGGAGVLVGRGTVHFRLEAGYHYLFVSGSDIGYVPARVGIVFGAH